jgi:hypothetical protein
VFGVGFGPRLVGSLVGVGVVGPDRGRGSEGEGDGGPDRVDPIRVHAFVLGEKRRRLLAERDRSVAALAALDRRLVALSRERRRLVRVLRGQRRVLFPDYAKRGRQPSPDGEERLPPVAADATRLWGRRLRAACRAVLAAARAPVALGDLHAVLHDQGYAVHSGHVVKALADAMAYEVESGRARRVGRGVYELAPSG